MKKPLMSIAFALASVAALASEPAKTTVPQAIDPIVCCGNSSPGQCNSCPRQ